MAVNLSPVGGVAAQFFTNSGVPLTGGKIFTYAAGTTTPQETYTTSAGNVPWTNPVVLDAAGRVPSGGEIWLTDGLIYKFVLKDANDVLIATYDNITGINSNAVLYTNQQEIVTATAGQTVFNLGISYQPGTNSISVFVDGVNQYGPGALYSYVETDSNTITFNSGLHVGAEVKFTTTQQQGAGIADASQITYDPPFTGSVATNVEAKLAQIVSVMDFGAVGDGVADDTAAFQAALNTGNAITAPHGSIFKITAPLTGTNVWFDGQGSDTEIRVYGGVDCFQISGVCNIKNVTIKAQSDPNSTTNKGITGAIYTSYFQNVYIAFFNTGFDFTTNSYLLKLDDCTAYDCVTGFKNYSSTTSATTTVFDHCYALSCGTGFYLYGVSDGELRNCAIDIGNAIDYPITNTYAIRTQYCSLNITATHIEGLPNADGFVCFDLTYPQAVNLIGGSIDIYQNAFTTVLFDMVGYSSPYSRVNITGLKQTPKPTQPATIRYRMRTDNVAYKLYVNAYDNAFIDTNATLRVGNFGSGNVGESWIIENNNLRQIPLEYKLTGTSSGVLQKTPTTTFDAVNTYTGETTITAGGPATAFTIVGEGMWFVSTFIGASGTNYRAVSLITSDGTTADITALKLANNVTLSLSSLDVQIGLTGGASGIVQYRALKIG